jgi:hypothetical protein
VLCCYSGISLFAIAVRWDRLEVWALVKGGAMAAATFVDVEWDSTYTIGWAVDSIIFEVAVWTSLSATTDDMKVVGIALEGEVFKMNVIGDKPLFDCRPGTPAEKNIYTVFFL